MERFEPGMAEGELALKPDALSLHHHAMHGWVLYFARRYEQALAQFRATTEP